MNKKSHTFLIIASVSFFTTASIFLYSLNEIHKQGINFAESKLRIGENVAKEASFNTVEGLLTSTKDDRAQINNFFINEKDTISFISEIENNAKLIGVKLATNELSIVPKIVDTSGVETPAILMVGFDFSGSEEMVFKFVTLLENIPYHKKVTQLSFTKSDTNVWKANIKMQLTLQ